MCTVERVVERSRNEIMGADLYCGRCYLLALGIPKACGISS